MLWHEISSTPEASSGELVIFSTLRKLIQISDDQQKNILDLAKSPLKAAASRWGWGLPPSGTEHLAIGKTTYQNGCIKSHEKASIPDDIRSFYHKRTVRTWNLPLRLADPREVYLLNGSIHLRRLGRFQGKHMFFFFSFFTEWIGWRENPQETIFFLQWNMGLSCKIWHKPIHCCFSFFQISGGYGTRNYCLNLWVRSVMITKDPDKIMYFDPDRYTLW